jgi:FixJ family two-component response regulator
MVRRLREQDGVVGIVMISGWGSQSLTALETNGVVDGVAAKPLDLTQLRNLVATVAQRAASRRQEARSDRS